MSISTDNWFGYLREEVLTEGLRDIGLPESVVDYIESAMADSPEKSKMYAGNQWKETILPPQYAREAQEYWNTFMSQVFASKIARSEDNKIVARTVPAYDINNPNKQRTPYDDEQIKQNERIAFVVQNVSNALAKPEGTWRKTFMKAIKGLSKAGVPSETVESVKEELDATISRSFKMWWRRFDQLFAWLNEEPTNYEMIKGESNIDTALSIALEDLQSKENPDQIMYQFKDGFYWYDLRTSNCSIEAERMGHCGSDTRGSLVSLRRRQDKRKASSSYVTMTWRMDTLYQIKGRSNNAPDSDLWDYINEFIQNEKISEVLETGEHSSDLQGFEDMIEYLQERNPDVNFEGMLNIDALQEAVDRVVDDYDGDYTSIQAEVQDPADYGGDGRSTTIYVTTEFSADINLGWSDIVRSNDLLYPSVGGDSDEADDNYAGIPEDSYTTLAADFESEIGIDELGYELPGDAESEYEVVMLMGVQPDDVPAGAEKPTAHLRITIRSTEVVTANDADGAFDEVNDIARDLYSSLEEKSAEIIEELRANLVNEDYAVKGAYDKIRTSLADKEFNHWNVSQESSTLSFQWAAEGGNNVINDGAEIPLVVKMYGISPASLVSRTYSQVFGEFLQGRPPRLENPDLNRNMARNLEKLFRATQEDPKQQKMDFGAGYDTRAPALVLAKDSHFIIQGRNSEVAQGGGYPKQPIDWIYELRMNSNTSSEEIQVVQDILDFFDENPQMVNQAALQTINDALSSTVMEAERVREGVVSGQMPQSMIRRLDSQYASQADDRPENVDAAKIMMAARWFNQNLASMDEVAKYVAYYQYLRPMVGGRLTGARLQIEVDGDDAGKPTDFDSNIQSQLVRMGAPGITRRARTQAQESIEEQINRINGLLQEKDPNYDLRLYNIRVNVSIQKDIGGEVQDTQTEIRGIEGVTTVRTVGNTRNVGRAQVGTYEIKFELIGNQGRENYRDRVLIPGLMKIKGLKILKMSPIEKGTAKGAIGSFNESKLKILKEYGVSNFGGVTSGLGFARLPSSAPMPADRKMIKQIIDDWSGSGVMDYDRPMNTNDSQYHVMMPVEELLPYTSNIFRAPKDAFDGMYRNFIKNGPEMPVYLAIGKNGRAKITGNEDIIWFAKKSGLQEVPVFFSYQNQV
jgi:hypothetical protein